MRKLTEAARIIRSKNSGPYELTLDIIFNTAADFVKARSANMITSELIAGLYGISVEELKGVIWFEPASAVKITMRRQIVSGAPGDTDVYGAQQHAPLLSLELPL
jgi:hypothetical protein